MKSSYYVVFDGTSAFVVDSNIIDNIAMDPFATESVLVPLIHLKKLQIEKMK